MKKIIQYLAFPLICRNCEKYMGDIAVEFDDPVKSKQQGDKILKFLKDSGSFPMCDVCTTQGNKMGQFMGRDIK